MISTYYNQVEAINREANTKLQELAEHEQNLINKSKVPVFTSVRRQPRKNMPSKVFKGIDLQSRVRNSAGIQGSAQR